MLNDADKIKDDKLTICSWCGQPAQITLVYRHGQCSLCGTNIDEYCRGEQCDNTLLQTNIPGINNNL